MEEEFEAPAHHEHAVEHKAEHGDSFSSKIAVLTAVFVCFGAFTSYLGNETEAKQLGLKNEAIRLRASASDVWAESQAQSQKAHLDEIAAYVAPEAERAGLAADAKAREKKKDQLQEKARALDEKSDQANEQAEALEKPHGRLALAMTLIQVSIAVCAISALTRKRWLLGLAGATFLGSLGVALSAWL
jgi:hypothetical protein